MAVLLLMSIVLLCCRGTKSLAPAKKDVKSEPSLVPDNADVTAAQAHWTGTTLANLTQGYNIYNDKCLDCHDVKKPQDFSIEDWNNTLPKMGRKSHLDSTQYKLVYRYILAKRETILAAKK